MTRSRALPRPRRASAPARVPAATNASLSAATRAVLLDAAEALLLARGGAGLTLDAVAARAKVSKGGLLYHFASKDALLVAMVGRLVEGVAQEFREQLGDGPPEPGRAIHAFIRTTGGDEEGQRRLNRLSSALLAVAAEDPKLLKPVQGFYAEVFAAIRADGGDLGRAFLMLAAADGLWLAQLLGLYTLRPAEQRAAEAAAEKLLSYTTQ